MRNRLVLLLGVLAALLLSTAVVVGAALEQWVVAAAGISLLLSGGLLVQLDAWRRVRALSSQLKDRAGGGVVRAPLVDGDVAGAVRVMQAQYTGRLDRMQTALDRALDELEDRRNAVDGERDGPGLS